MLRLSDLSVWNFYYLKVDLVGGREIKLYPEIILTISKPDSINGHDQNGKGIAIPISEINKITVFLKSGAVNEYEIKDFFR